MIIDKLDNRMKQKKHIKPKLKNITDIKSINMTDVASLYSWSDTNCNLVYQYNNHMVYFFYYASQYYYEMSIYYLELNNMNDYYLYLYYYQIASYNFLSYL